MSDFLLNDGLSSKEEVKTEFLNYPSDTDKSKEQNRICQLAFKERQKTPKSFCLVALHLIQNALRYYEKEEGEVEKDLQCKLFDASLKNEKIVANEQSLELENKSTTTDVNKQLCVIRMLKHRNCIREQQDHVAKLKKIESYRDLNKKNRSSTENDSCMVFRT